LILEQMLRNPRRREGGTLRRLTQELGRNWLLDAAALWILFFGFGHLAFC
jgi:hypothetical protein